MHIPNGSEIPSVSILKLFVDIFISFSEKGGNHYLPLNCEHSPFRFINDNLTLSQTTNCRLVQIGRVCRRQFQFVENGRKFFKQVENTVGKGKIARYEQFLLFPQCFQKTCTADT